MILELDAEMEETIQTVLVRRHRQVPGTREQAHITRVLRAMEAARAEAALGIAPEPAEASRGSE